MRIAKPFLGITNFYRLSMVILWSMTFRSDHVFIFGRINQKRDLVGTGFAKLLLFSTIRLRKFSPMVLKTRRSQLHFEIPASDLAPLVKASLFLVKVTSFLRNLLNVLNMQHRILNLVLLNRFLRRWLCDEKNEFKSGASRLEPLV